MSCISVSISNPWSVFPSAFKMSMTQSMKYLLEFQIL
uniref:Uncharacterized protein n=1 Tax=Anguilla anguilla TaxID=7936 RepID=A0A0E9SWD7_ANGAN